MNLHVGGGAAHSKWVWEGLPVCVTLIGKITPFQIEAVEFPIVHESTAVLIDSPTLALKFTPFLASREYVSTTSLFVSITFITAK